MVKFNMFALALLSITATQPAFSQGIFESGAVDSMAVGLGAGLAASLGKGALVGKTYQAGVDAQMSAAQALQLQTRAIEQYMKIGSQYQAKKDWQNAEKSFQYVMKVSVLRDGPGSPKMAPTLQHLSEVTAAQGNFHDAINFQERVVNLAKNMKVPEPASIINAQIGLSNLYLKQKDYHSAEPVLQESYELANRSPALAPQKRKVIARTYGDLLRKMGKNAEAQKVDPEALPVVEMTPLVMASPASQNQTNITQEHLANGAAAQPGGSSIKASQAKSSQHLPAIDNQTSSAAGTSGSGASAHSAQGPIPTDHDN